MPDRLMLHLYGTTIPQVSSLSSGLEKYNSELKLSGLVNRAGRNVNTLIRGGGYVVDNRYMFQPCRLFLYRTGKSHRRLLVFGATWKRHTLDNINSLSCSIHDPLNTSLAFSSVSCARL
jgi:hypothetical protein